MLKIILSFVLVSIVQAHEGHDHGPGQDQPPKGGIMRSLETVRLELLHRGKSVQIYIYDTKMKPADAAKYEVSATVTLPRKKAENLPLIAKGDHWEAEFDAKGAHRYALELNIKQGGHNDKVKFTVEPKK